MSQRRVGLWLIGALGNVGSTVALGLSSLARDAIAPVGMTTALPMFDGLDFDPPTAFVLGGHDIRSGTFMEGVQALHERSNVFSQPLIQAAAEQLRSWSANIRPGTILRSGDTIRSLVNRPEVCMADDPQAAIERIQTDLREFQERHRLTQVVVVNVASTEPMLETIPGIHDSLAGLRRAIDRGDPNVLPASALYAYASLDLGLPYVNFTPSVGADLPALIELANLRRAVIAGRDGKTGETLIKTALAPLFAVRNLQVLSWVSHNILGNRDGQVLNDPRHKESKNRSKDAALGQLLGYKPQSHISIEYMESLDDWKTAWDHVHFAGFFGVKMTLQFTWQGCDSILAAPLVIDLARLALFAQRRGESGVLAHLACFFKSPMGVEEHHLYRQFAFLEEYARNCRNAKS